jgi:hypothetical protein
MDLGDRRENAFGTPGICAETGELCGAACGCSAAATACGCGVCGACWRRYDQGPLADNQSIHDVLAFIATQPGIGCWRACNMMSASFFLAVVEVFALLVIIADTGGLVA